MARTVQTARKLLPSQSAALKATKAVGTAKPGGLLKPHRYKPGTVALREIRRYQKSTDRIIRKAPFERICREVLANYSVSARFQAEALSALHEATELHIVGTMADANLLAVHSKRVTVHPKDMYLVTRFRSKYLPTEF